MKQFQSLQLLESLADRGYPLEYLLSRIRGRRSRLVADWKQAAYDYAPLEGAGAPRATGLARERSPEAIWRNLLREHRWIYGQMHHQLRNLFGPYFLYAEMRTLFIGLRHIREQKAEGTEDLLAVSLLAPGAKRVLLESVTLEEAVVRLGALFRSRSVDLGALEVLLDKEGLRGVEQQVTDRLICVLLKEGRLPVIKDFFARLIDARNILSLYKALRLNASRPPRRIPAGAISDDRFQRILQSMDLFTVTALVRDVTGLKIAAPDITTVEIALYRWVTRHLRKGAREPLGAGLLLDYLWRCSIEAMNLSLLAHGREIERETVQAELVY